MYLPEKPAPVSISWWIGSAYTTGLSSIDYFITDNVMAPNGSEHLFSEKIWHLPHHAIWDHSELMGEVGPLPALWSYYFWSQAIRINDRYGQIS